MAYVIENKPVLGKSWQTATLDTGDIHDQISALWAELQRAQPPIPKAQDGYTDPKLTSGLMRANTLNLLAVAPTARDAKLIQESVAQLRDFLPSRTIIILMHDAREAGQAGDLYDVNVELIEQMTQGSSDEGPKLRFETITIGAPIQEVGHLPSLVEPLFVPELEDFLWWPAGDHTHSDLFFDLVDIVDHVIIDSALSGRDQATVAALQQLFTKDDTMPPVGDFTWQRLSPWRSLVAQFFDAPDTQACLNSIERVTIRYASDRMDGSSGAPAAFYMVSWLASRLGWELMDSVERSKDGTYWAPLRSKAGEKGREIVLRIEPDSSPHARFSLRSVELVAGGNSPGTFKVERTDSDDLVTSSETPANPPVSRMVYSKRPDVVSMLADELRQFGRDPVFEETVRFAVRLVGGVRQRR
jgi:glucose-6-phosphate dehydrogenase assembly protein OpcA